MDWFYILVSYTQVFLALLWSWDCPDTKQIPCRRQNSHCRNLPYAISLVWSFTAESVSLFWIKELTQNTSYMVNTHTQLCQAAHIAGPSKEGAHWQLTAQIRTLETTSIFLNYLYFLEINSESTLGHFAESLKPCWWEVKRGTKLSWLWIETYFLPLCL